MSITIKDVARIAGVSPSTVSKVINQNHTISEPTIKKVESAIRNLNYTPNERARNLARKSTKIISFITLVKRDMAFVNPHLFEIMVGAQSALAQKDYSMEFIGIKHKSLELIQQLIESKHVDGLIVHASALTQEIARYIVKSKIPHSVIGMPNFPNGVCWVDNNNNLSGQIAAKHILAIEKEQIAYIGGKTNDSISELRLEGIKEELSHHNLKIEANHIIKTNSSFEEGYNATLKLLEQKPRPNAIICANNLLDLGCIKALNDLGIKIPDEIAVITFDDYPYSIITNPPTTAINIDVYDLGQQAARLLMEKIRKPNYQFQTYMTVPLLVTRQSTRKQF
jgi:DNA-binding LacI/PurR family transcriptional regulator